LARLVFFSAKARITDGATAVFRYYHITLITSWLHH